MDAYDSVINRVELHTSATVTLTNTTYIQLRLYDSTEVHVCWYLDVQVVDDTIPGQSVESANVTATFLNGTLVGQAVTDLDGWARLALMEKMTNASGDYPVGIYAVNATYLSYYGSTDANMTESQAIILTLEGFVVPEFPSLLIMSLCTIATLLAILGRKKKGKLSGTTSVF